MAPSTRRHPALNRTLRRSLSKAVWQACEKEDVPCTNQDAQLVVRVVASVIEATRSLEGCNKGRWFRIPDYLNEQLDVILPVVFSPMVDTPNAGSLHAAFNAALSSELPGGRGFQVRKPSRFWHMRIVSDDQSFATADPVHLKVR